jgi:hypothetical protein
MERALTVPISGASPHSICALTSRGSARLCYERVYICHSAGIVATKHTIMRLPPELLDKIFALASEDGGKTTCALRASSQAFRVMNEPYHLKTVLVTSVESICALCDTLRSIPEQRRIQTLHIRLELTSAKPRSLKRWLRRLLPASDNEELAAPSILANHAVTSLCHLCASSLLTLALMVDDNLGPFFDYLRVFQSIRDWLIHTVIIGHVKCPRAVIGSLGNTLPQLEQLYLGGCEDATPWQWTGGVWTNIPHIHVQCRSNHTAHVLFNNINVADAILGYSPTPQVLHLWPMVRDQEWEDLEASEASVVRDPTAQRRWEV